MNDNLKVIIRAEELSKCFKGEIHALRGINLEVKKGEVVVILGPSGSGKSTCLRSLNLLEDPTSGHIYFRLKRPCRRISGTAFRRTKAKSGNLPRIMHEPGRYAF